MAENIKMYWLHVLTPLHVGVGQGVGFIDLPIMREKVTGWPVTPGSAVKGVISDRADPNGDKRKKKKDEAGYDARFVAAFGRADQDGESANSGSLVFTDARLVCLPVRSLFGTFAWVTSPLALQRERRDLDAAGLGIGRPTDCGTIGKIHLPQDPPSVLRTWPRISSRNSLASTPLSQRVQRCVVLRGSYFRPNPYRSGGVPERPRRHHPSSPKP